jgi:tetratricopeptide (TPR) repeat protein
MTRALRGLAALTLLCTASLAAQNPIADRMFSLPGKDAPEGTVCKLSGGDFHIGSAATYLHSALAATVADNKRRLLAQGRDQSLIGIQGGQAGSSKAWYYLARIYLQLGDLVGADSAFTRTDQLEPTCAAEVHLYRVRAWSTLISAVSAHRIAGRGDSAVYLARAANQIDPSRPQAWYTIGAQFLDAQQDDSASIYLEKALASPEDSSVGANSIRQAAAYQAGVIAYNRHDFPGAVRLFAEAVRLKSDDNDAKRNLSASLRQAGMADSASKIEGSMMAATAGSEGGLTVGQLFDIGVAQFNQRDFANAAGTFEKIVAAEPFNRDALFNLAQSYNGSTKQADSLLTAAQRTLTAHPRDTVALRVKTTTTPIQAAVAAKLLESALKLQAIDPLSYEALQLVGAGYRAKHDQANVLKVATTLGGATIDVKVSAFQVTATGATITLHATGKEGRDINDRVVPAAPIPIVVEFLDKAGTVVATSEATLPALAANATQDIPVTGAGAGIAAWRYRRK